MKKSAEKGGGLKEFDSVTLGGDGGSASRPQQGSRVWDTGRSVWAL